MVGLYGERLDNRLMVLQILVPLHEITTLVESFVFVNSLFDLGVSNLAVTPGWFFSPFLCFTKKTRFLLFFRMYLILCDPSAFSDKSDSYITCFCLCHRDTFCVTADTKVLGFDELLLCEMFCFHDMNKYSWVFKWN